MKKEKNTEPPLPQSARAILEELQSKRGTIVTSFSLIQLLTTNNNEIFYKSSAAPGAGVVANSIGRLRRAGYNIKNVRGKGFILE